MSQCIKRTLERGFLVQDNIQPDQVEQVFALWGGTFGWAREEVLNLSERLKRERRLLPWERSIWFAAIRKEEEINFHRHGRKTGFPLKGKISVDLVESTEWKTKEDYEGQGLNTAAVVHLNCQIFRDLAQAKIHPVIFAETNFNSRSDRVAHGAGMVIPER